MDATAGMDKGKFNKGLITESPWKGKGLATNQNNIFNQFRHNIIGVGPHLFLR